MPSFKNKIEGNENEDTYFNSFPAKCDWNSILPLFSEILQFPKNSESSEIDFRKDVIASVSINSKLGQFNWN